jgi:hypothetical protein
MDDGRILLGDNSADEAMVLWVEIQLDSLIYLYIYIYTHTYTHTHVFNYVQSVKTCTEPPRT